MSSRETFLFSNVSCDGKLFSALEVTQSGRGHTHESYGLTSQRLCGVQMVTPQGIVSKHFTRAIGIVMQIALRLTD